MPAAIWPENEAIAAGLYDAPGQPTANGTWGANPKLIQDFGPQTQPSYVTPGVAPAGTSPVQITLGGAKDEMSSGQSAFNGWMNYWASKLTGQPSGNTGTNNPSAPDSPAGQSILSGLDGYITRAVLIVLGMIFVGVGLKMFNSQS